MTGIALLMPTVLGFLVLASLLRREQETGLLERLCLSYPLGAGLLTMQIFVLGLLRVPLTLVNTSLPILIEIVLLSIWFTSQKISPVPTPSFGLRDEFLSSKVRWVKKAALVILMIWAGAKLFSVFFETGLRPIYAWDAWANWSVGAKLFYYTKSLLLDVPSQDFFTRGAVLRITAYPLHNPLMQTWISLWTGGFDDVLVKFWNPLYLLCMTGYLYLTARKELDTLAAWILLVIFLSSPLMSYHAVEAYSDLALSVYLFLASVSFLHAMRGKEGFWILTGIFSAEALFTKDEALFFVAPLLASALLYLWRDSSGPLKRGTSALRLALSVLLVAPWYIFKVSHALGLGADQIKLEFTFHPEIIWSSIRQILSLGNFNILVVFFPLLLLLNGKPSREFFHIFIAVTCYAVFFLAVYIFTTFYYYHFSQDTVFFRNILTYYPVIVLLTILLLKSLFLSITQAETSTAGQARKQLSGEKRTA